MASSSQLTASPRQTNVFLDSLIADIVYRRGTSITYAFLNTDRAAFGTSGGQSWTSSGATAAFEGALTAWRAVANLDIRRWSFTYTGGNRDGITWVESLDQLGRSNPLLGEHSYPVDPTQTGSYNIDHPYFSAASNAAGGFSFLTFLHEIGHAIGLEHPHGDTPFPGVTNENDTGDFGLNRTLYTVMSYNEALPNGSESYSRSFGWQKTPGAFDIAAVQALYGANMATAAGDTVWRLPTENIAGTGYACIWDAGGTDWISAEGASSAADIDLNAATLLYGADAGGLLSSVRGIYGGFTIANGVTIENARGGNGDDRITGNAAANRLEGGNGSDGLFGGAGNDTLAGGAQTDLLDGGTGADVLAGGSGDDRYVVDDSGDIVIEAAGEGYDIVEATASSYLYANVEELRLQGNAAIFGVGNAEANSIAGNDADNLLLGGSGDDTIIGQLGNDALFGEAGSDSLIGAGGIDYLVGGDGNDMLDGDRDADALYGEAGDDLLVGGTSFDTDILVGGAGDDTLRGDSDAGDYDLLNGGAGNDVYYVDTPADLTFEAAGDGVDTVIARITGAGYYLYPNVENLELVGATPFGVGNELANALTAGVGSQWLLGGAGDDTIDGGGGDDVLFGEGGADLFLFRKMVPADPYAGAAPVATVTSGRDVIGDFQPGVDRIQILGFGITGFDQLRLMMVEVAGTVAVNFGNGNFVVLNGVPMAALSTGDFLFG